MMPAQVAAARIGAGATLGAAHMNNLQQLYSNWAALTEKGGEAQAQSALETGKMMQSPLITRAGIR
jgi:hypothetical protein